MTDWEKTYQDVPRELKTMPQWVVRRGKIPLNPCTGEGAKAGQPDTWSTFETALSALQKGYDGVGFEFNNNGIVGIDLDHVIDKESGKIAPEAQKIVDLLNSYTEISPSGTGLHIYVYGDIPTKGRKNTTRNIEMYKAARYFTVTGNVYGSVKPIERRDKETVSLYNELFPEPENKPTAPRYTPTVTTDKNYLAIGLEKDPKFKDIWLGRCRTGDESSDDMSLMNKLAYWCNCDERLMIDAFRSSPYAGEKDPIHLQKAERKDYLSRTAAEAIRKCNRTALSDDQSFQKERLERDFTSDGDTLELSDKQPPSSGQEEWLTFGKDNKPRISEPQFARYFYTKYKMLVVNNRFYDDFGEVKTGKVKQFIQQEIEPYFKRNLSNRVRNLFDVVKVHSYAEPPKPEENEIHCLNGTLVLDEQANITLEPLKFTLNRFNLDYVPDAPNPEKWTSFLDGLLYPDDILTLQEYMGYCLIPTTRAQTALFIIGKGGEGKSRLGGVLRSIFGNKMVSDKIHKLEDDRFLLSRLENCLLFYDDDLQTKKMTETGTFKNLITADVPVLAESKGIDKYELLPYTRFISCGNNALSSCFDKSDGFYRRQLILSCKPKPADRIDDRFLVEKLIEEKQGIFNWCIAGLQRLMKNKFEFTRSDRALENIENLKREDTNIIDFMNDTGYLMYGERYMIHTAELLNIYFLWCKDNACTPFTERTFTSYVKDNQDKFKIQHKKQIYIYYGRERRKAKGYTGVCATDPISERMRRYAEERSKNSS